MVLCTSDRNLLLIEYGWYSRAMVKKQKWFRRIKKDHMNALRECEYYINNEEGC